MRKFFSIVGAVIAWGCAANAVELHDGDTISGTVGSGAQVEHTFAGETDDLVSLFVDEDNIYGSNKFTLTIYRPDDTVLYTETDYNGTGTRRLALDRTGSYRVVYQALGDGASYTLYFHNEGEALRAGDVLELNDGDIDSGTLTGHDVDLFRFQGETGDRITLCFDDDNIYSANKFTLIIYSPDGSELYSETDYQGTGTQRVELGQDGTYKLVYFAEGSEGCNYTFYYYNEGEAVRNRDVADLVDGSHVSDTLDGYDFDLFAFNAQTGDPVGLFVDEDNIYSSYKFTLKVLRPDGTELFSETSYSGTGDSRIMADQDGDYRVVYLAETATGCSYDLYFNNLGEVLRDSDPILLPNAQKSEWIKQAHDHDIYRLRGYAAETANFVCSDSFSSSSADLFIEFYAPDGTLLYSQNSAYGFTTSDITLPVSSGDYTLVVYAEGSYTGNYAIEYVNPSAANWPQPVLENQPADLAFQEDDPVAIGVLDFNTVFSDPDNVDSELAYSIVLESPSGVVDLTLQADGTLDVAPQANAFGAVSISVRATDPEGLIGECSFGIEVQSVPDAPQLDDESWQVWEETEVGYLVGIPQVADNDPDETFAWSILSGNESGCFQIDPDTGEIRLALHVDFEDVPAYSLELQVEDSEGLTDTATVAIAVVDGNDRPVCVNDAYASNEDAPVLFVDVATGILSNDSDSNGDAIAVDAFTTNTPLGCVLAVNADGSFSYNASGAQQLKAGESVDEQFILTVRDVHGLPSVSTLTITLNGANDTPTAIELSSTTIPPVAFENWRVGRFSTADPDSGDSFAYALEPGGTDNDWFRIDGDELLLARDYPLGGASPLEVAVRSTDAQGEYVVESFSIGAAGNVVYVDADAPAGGDGSSPETAFNLLQEAIDAAQSGDLIDIDAGMYAGPFTIDRSVSLIGTEGTILDGGRTGDYGIQVTADFVTLWTIHLTHSQNNAVYLDEVAHFTMKDCVIGDTLGQSKTSGSGAFVYNSSDVLFDGIVVTNVIGGAGSVYTLATYPGYGIYASGSDSVTIRNSRFADLGGNGPCGISACNGSDQLRVEGCVFEDIVGEDGKILYPAPGVVGPSDGKDAMGIYLEGSTGTVVSDCMFASSIQGGVGPSYDHGLWVEYGDHGWAYGIYAESTGIAVEKCTFNTAAEYGMDVYLTGTTVATVGGGVDKANEFRETGTDICIYNNTSNTIDATCNVWLASQPDTVIYDLLDDPSLGRVDSSSVSNHPPLTCSLASGLNLTFGPCTNGTTYTCEWCTNLAEGVWRSFSGTVSTNGSCQTIALPDTAPFNTSPAVCLRVKEE